MSLPDHSCNNGTSSSNSMPSSFPYIHPSHKMTKALRKTESHVNTNEPSQISQKVEELLTEVVNMSGRMSFKKDI